MWPLAPAAPLLPALLFLGPLAADVTAADAPPAPASCPAGMRLVEGDHAEAAEHDCIAVKDGYCVAFKPGPVHKAGRVTHVRACVDEFEAPNVRGQRPIVMLSSVEAEAWCGERGKRLCAEYEWEQACEGPDQVPWGYGWEQDSTKCNSGKRWMKFDAVALMSGGDVALRETERLWQGEASGTSDQCASPYGVHDMTGNVEEWVRSSRPRQWPTALMGGFWAKSWTQCRGTNAAHEPTFRFYEVGFRCCSDPR